MYKALGLYSDLGRLFFSPSTPAALTRRGAAGAETLKSANANYFSAGLSAPKPADTTQQGGCLVVNSAGLVSYAWRDAGTGDFAPTESVLSAVMADA